MNNQQLEALQKAKDLNDMYGLGIEDKDIEQLIVNLSVIENMTIDDASHSIKSVLRQFKIERANEN